MPREIALSFLGENLYASRYFLTMGNFRQHITCSTVTGIAVGGIAYHFGFIPPVCLVSAGLCSFAGMLPDIDSDTSKSFHECLYLTAGIGCMLTAARLRNLGMDPDFAMLGGAFMFLLIRFGLGTLIKTFTVHRGMIHSIPMAIFAGEIAFFVVAGSVQERLVKAAALTVGYLSHLVLDEVYSIDSTGATLRLKKSFGTALKWTNPKQKGAVMLLYMLVSCVGYAVISHPEVIDEIADNGNEQATVLSPLPDDYVLPMPPIEVQREAAEFLMQQSSVASIDKPYATATTRPANGGLSLFVQESTPAIPADPMAALETEVPSAMPSGNVWNRHAPILPAPIVLP